MNKKVYTVFYDYGEWLWVKDAEDETMYVGTCVLLDIEDKENQIFSKDFLDFSHTWSASLASVIKSEISMDTFDWETAHQKGLEVARRFKEHLGNNSDVRYVKPGEDPTRTMEDGYEILSDATVNPIKRLWWCPL